MARWRQGTTFQSLSFNKDHWTAKEARAWASSNGFKGGKLEETDHTITLQQQDPKKFRRTSFRTVTLDDGVQATVAVPVDPSEAPEEQTFSQSLAELKAEIKASKEMVQSEWKTQKKTVSDTLAHQRKLRASGPDPISDFFRWLKKKR